MQLYLSRLRGRSTHSQSAAGGGRCDQHGILNEAPSRTLPRKRERERTPALAYQPGSMPFVLITASAAGAARNLMNALATSPSLLAAEAAAEKYV